MDEQALISQTTEAARKLRELGKHGFGQPKISIWKASAMTLASTHESGAVVKGTGRQYAEAADDLLQRVAEFQR